MKCDLLNNENECTKSYNLGKPVGPIKCVPSDISWCNQRLEICELNQICRNASPFGNYCFYITDDDIEKLKQGKILFDLDEYGIFIGYRKEI
ncbi:MAG: hypothetical protein J1E81_07485 [Eubacterium sp.]|nr:hypothetical protein [Eubacterium sp.]